MNRLALVVFFCTLIPPAFGYENACTHPQMTRNAIDILNNSGTIYFELFAQKPVIANGANIEDVTNFPFGDFAVFNHFYEPRTRRALNVGGVVGPIVLNGVSLGLQQDALSRGSVLWNAAVTQYAQGQKSQAFTSLGRSLHLLTQDMSQPGHVHNDPHIPKPAGWFGFWPGLDGSQASPLEIVAEGICNGGQLSPGDSVKMAPAGLYAQPVGQAFKSFKKSGDGNHFERSIVYLVMRRPRIHYPGATYHTMTRGVDGRDTFTDDRDRALFLKALTELKAGSGFSILAYCLMGNHFHLAIKIGQVPLSRILQRQTS